VTASLEAERARGKRGAEGMEAFVAGLLAG
jgi:hypothetical protein